MSINKTTSKKFIYEQQLSSPRYNYETQHTIADKNSQTKLTEKVQKLKNALRAS